MAAATVEIAVVAKLKATAAVTDLVATRVFTQLDTQEPAYPQLVVTKLAADGGRRLSGAAHALKAYTVRIDCYAGTELEAGAVGKAVRDSLCPDGTPWTDATNGVQGCFFTDSTGDTTESGLRVQSETFTVWHTPT